MLVGLKLFWGEGFGNFNHISGTNDFFTITL